jgi:hypothetical protein
LHTPCDGVTNAAGSAVMVSQVSVKSALFSIQANVTLATVPRCH